MRLSLLISCSIMLFISSCNCDDCGDLEEIDVGLARGIIINEGNFGFGNASISLYNPDGGSISNKLFQANNMGRPIGDIVQSVQQIGDKIYIVVNNSSKIEVVDKTSFKSNGNISPLNSPRYILPIDTTRAYVSDLYEDKLYVIDYTNLSVQSTISITGWIEEMAMVNNMVFACHMDSGQVLVIDPSNNQVVHRIATNHSPQHIEIDVDNNLWVSCSGGFEEDLAAIYKINGTNYSVERVFEANDSTISFGEIEMNKEKNLLYYLSNDGLYKLGVSDSIMPTTALITASNQIFYGLSVDEQTDDIYICDPIDYQQKGVVYRYDNEGRVKHIFEAGIIPSDVFFLN